MQSNGPNANKASIICILEISLLEYGTSIRLFWVDNLIISRSNSLIYTSYDTLLLMRSSLNAASPRKSSIDSQGAIPSRLGC